MALEMRSSENLDDFRTSTMEVGMAMEVGVCR